mmetsp:Transcript_35778/g.52518  ORF Transcript_35778/g.52518 Transcript_35778/m.52518 type:complete len:86 (+) Transcript_35778:63-320(+)
MVPLLDAIFALSLMPSSSILLRLRLASSCRLAVRCVAQEAEKRVSAQEKRASAQEKRGCAQEAMCSFRCKACCPAFMLLVLLVIE